jgi:hypothetical protein
VADLLEHLFQVDKKNPLWLVLEEADVFAPQDSCSREAPARSPSTISGQWVTSAHWDKAAMGAAGLE